MDRLILNEKLESLRRCVARVEQRRADSVAALRADPDCQDILSLNLTRAVQLCVDIAVHILADTSQPAPQTMAEAFDGLATEGLIDAELARRLRRAVGFRNVAIHQYEAIDWAIVHTIAHQGIADFQRFAQAVDAVAHR